VIGRGALAVAMLVATAACATPADLGHVDIIAGTNEPFYSIEVRGTDVRLTGVDAPPRLLRVTRRTPGDQGVTIDAADVAGTLRLQLSERACEDDMSGAAFPFTAVLTLGTRSHRGCARRLTDPAPREPG